MEIKIEKNSINLGYIAEQLNMGRGSDSRSLLINEQGDTGIVHNHLIQQWDDENGEHCLVYDLAQMGSCCRRWHADSVESYLDGWAMDEGYRLIW